MPAQSQNLDAIVIGAGPSGIAMAHTLKHKLGFSDFMLFEKLDGVGGTWRTNTYPGVGCDVPTHLYSFSFNLNPRWSKELCDGPEILEYMEATVDKFNLRPHMHFQVECLGAKWLEGEGKWEVSFHDLLTGIKYQRRASVFVSAVGGISYPRDVRFPGMEKFQGAMFHTAHWDHTYDYSGKRMAVIGNGCSAAQVVPAVVGKVKYARQYARSPQWYHERPNRNFTEFEKLCFKYVPLWQRILRLRLFLDNDSLVATYMSGKEARKLRAAVEDHAKGYIYSTAPKKYHNQLVPDFPLGCKRRIFDPGYLEALHAKNLDVVQEGIREIDETGIVGDSGERTEFDVIVLATGFQVSQFLTPMEIIGRTGTSLTQQWKENRGAQAYLGTFVHNFPNFAILFGPNTFPAHNSALFACEVQVDYVAKSLFAPLIDKRTRMVEVKATAEDVWVNSIHTELSGSVFQAGCSNWYINEFGRNAASWPGYASTFWRNTLVPRFGDYVWEGGSGWWVANMLRRWIKVQSTATYSLAVILLALGVLRRNPDPRQAVMANLGSMVSRLRW